MTQGPYHLISIGILLILSYLLSLLMVRLQLLPSRKHKRVWNSFLLLFFSTAALLGLLLAIKVNYKLDVDWVDRAMQWHVNMGIGLVFIAIFHLTWHLGYYKKAFTREASVDQVSPPAPHLEIESWQVRLLFIMLGFISIIAQLVLLREFIKTLLGNELVIGIYLAIWMILTAAGAWAGSAYRARISWETLLKLLIFLAGFPLVVYLLLLGVTRIFFLPGYEPGMLASICYMIVLIILFTLVSGFLFAYISRSVKSKHVDSTYYMLDSLGSLAGGVVFGLILVFFFDNVQVLAFLFLAITLSLILVLRIPSGMLPRIVLIGSGILIMGIVQVPGIRNALEEMRYRNESVLDTRDTPFGNLTFTSRDEQVTVYLDRNPVISSFDPSRIEESVHFPALQRDNPSAFLLIGGGLSGYASEVIKYKPGVFDYCEVNPWIFRMGKEHLHYPDLSNIRVLDMDGRGWLMKGRTSKYDVIISVAGDPLTIGWNRYFTREYFQLVSSHLSPGGVFCMQLSTGGNYINEEGSQMLSINYLTLQQEFRYVLPVPGYATYFLASQEPLSLDFPGLLEQRPVPTSYVHSDYLDATRMKFDSDQILERLNTEQVRVNSDLWPVLFFSSIASWRSKVGGGSLWVTGLISLVVFLVLFLSYSPLKSGLYVTGFTGAGIQILLIMVIQSLYGFVYLVAPIMITIFMAGIVAGTRSWDSIWRKPSLSKYTGLLWIMAVLLAAAVIILKNEQLFSYPLPGKMILGLLNFIPGVLVGSVYGMSLALSGKEGSAGIGRLYSADLAGAALGSFIPAVFILPLIGVTNTFILFCGINVATGLYMLTRWKSK